MLGGGFGAFSPRLVVQATEAQPHSSANSLCACVLRACPRRPKVHPLGGARMRFRSVVASVSSFVASLISASLLLG